MTGTYLFNNLIDELNKARDLLQDNNIDSKLVSDIDADLEKVFEYRDSIDEVLEDVNIQMYEFSICVKELEIYDNIIADSEEKAKIIALDKFRDDDEWYGSKEAESATVDDCKIIDKNSI